jgi:hydroxymethylglutaryl-CoA lyase
MQGADYIVENLNNSNCDYSVLVPNLQGYQSAKNAGAKTVSVVPAATEKMNQMNINMSLDQSLSTACEIMSLGKVDKIKTRAYIAVAWECPYEGKVEEENVLKIADQLIEAGADELILADTIGAANPESVKSLVSKVIDRYSIQISAHFHDTRALALVNVWSALNCGVKKFDSCIGGLGGCPFAPGASGNLATEDIVNMLHQSGYTTNVKEDALMDAVRETSKILNYEIGGRMTKWLTKEDIKKQQSN